MTTLLAPVRLSPVPPASVEIKNMNTSGELLNLSIIGMPKHYEKQGSSKIMKRNHTICLFDASIKLQKAIIYGIPVEKIPIKTYENYTVLRLVPRWNSNISRSLTDLVKIRTLFVRSFFHSLRRTSKALNRSFSKRMKNKMEFKAAYRPFTTVFSLHHRSSILGYVSFRESYFGQVSIPGSLCDKECIRVTCSTDKF